MTDSNDIGPIEEFAPPKRHLSAYRVVTLVAVVAAAVATWIGVSSGDEPDPTAAPQSWFAPYVDVTSTPTYPFETSSRAATEKTVLAFVVSDHDDACEPSWGGFYSMAAAGETLDLDRRVARLRQLGGDAIISFGGAANAELSIGCTDRDDLVDAYQSVLTRYSATVLDLDIEGAASMAPEVSARRAQAIATLSSRSAAAGAPLSVWLTLPIAETGLTTEGLAQVTGMLAAGVPLAGVNAMTMDYGVPFPAGRTMADTAQLALTALHAQLLTAYAAAGTTLSDAETWLRIGATPMIGQNDIRSEVFGITDAQQVVAFAEANGLRRLSIWSANRDQGCGPNYPDVRIVSDVCSGVTQDPGDFRAVLSTFGSGGAAPVVTSTEAPTSAATTDVRGSDADLVDDPATSPYVIWNEDQAWPKDSKVVWHRNVYQAKWYTIGDVPDAPVASVYDTPWTLIGPVLPGERPAPTPTMSAGSYPDWNATTAYIGGDRVLLDGVGYQAKWWTKGDIPGVLGDLAESPWVLITTP